MIDFVDFFEKQIAIWNDEELCDSCWKFEYSERESEINESNQTDDDCCIMVFMTNLRDRSTYNYKQDSPWPTSKTTRHTMNIYFLKNDRIDINVHKEIKGHPVEESKYHTILRPIKDCIDKFDFCQVLGRTVKRISDDCERVLDYQDNGYSGYRYQFQFEETIDL